MTVRFGSDYHFSSLRVEQIFGITEIDWHLQINFKNERSFFIRYRITYIIVLLLASSSNYFSRR